MTWLAKTLVGTVALVVVMATANVTMAKSASTEVKASGAGCEPAPMPVCKEPRCINYCSHRSRCGCFDPCKVNKIVLQVPDHCCCCLIEVPVCVPACCTDAPSVCSHCGIFGRQVIEYSWCCGYYVKVVIDRCGNVTVQTFGL